MFSYETLKRLRVAYGPQSVIARRTRGRIRQDLLSRLETGAVPITDRHARILARAFGIPLDFLKLPPEAITEELLKPYPARSVYQRPRRAAAIPPSNVTLALTAPDATPTFQTDDPKLRAIIERNPRLGTLLANVMAMRERCNVLLDPERHRKLMLSLWEGTDGPGLRDQVRFALEPDPEELKRAEDTVLCVWLEPSTSTDTVTT